MALHLSLFRGYEKTGCPVVLVGPHPTRRTICTHLPVWLVHTATSSLQLRAASQRTAESMCCFAQSAERSQRGVPSAGSPMHSGAPQKKLTPKQVGLSIAFQRGGCLVHQAYDVLGNSVRELIAWACGVVHTYDGYLDEPAPRTVEGFIK